MRLGSDTRDTEDKVLVTMKGGEEGMKHKGVLLEGEWRGGAKRRRKERKGKERSREVRYILTYLLPPPNEQSPRFLYRNLEVSQHECK